jgi:hypothetical protein
VDRNTLYARRKAAVDKVLSKMPSNPTNDARAAEIRALLDHGDGFHQEVGMLRLIEVLADFPA